MVDYANNQESLTYVFDKIGISQQAIEGLVPLLNRGFQRPKHSVIIDQLEGGIQNKLSEQRKFKVYLQADDYANATILNRAANGSYLVLTLTNPNFAAIPVGNMVVSTSKCMAKVENKSAGSMTISFVANANGNTAFVSADFAANEQVIDRGPIGNIANRMSVETIFSVPSPIYNIVPTYNQTCEITQDDAKTTTYLTGPNGEKHYALMKDVQTLQRMYSQYIARTLDNVPAVLDGNEPIGASLLNQILTMGGGQTSLTSTDTFTETTIQDLMDKFIATGSCTTDEVLVICGSKYMGNVQRVLAPYILNSGTRNTLGGQTIQGINLQEYGYMKNLKFVVDPILDNYNMWGTNAQGFSNRSNSAMYMSVQPAMTEQGVSIPFITSRYFADTPDIARTVINGMNDDKGRHVTSGSNGKKAATIEYTMDKVDQLSNPASCWYHGE